MLTAIIVAAGSSRRMGFDKLFADLNGKPVIAHSVAAFQECADVASITVVARPERELLLRGLAQTEGWSKLRRIVPGGAERRLSVWNALETLEARGERDFVAVHDGARPLVTPAMISACLRRATEIGAACCAAPVSDTLKRADAENLVAGAVDRTGLWGMQTPQIFRAGALLAAYQAVLEQGVPITDEASAFEATGQPVALMDAGAYNFKITYPQDLALAALVLAQNHTHMNEKD